MAHPGADPAAGRAPGEQAQVMLTKTKAMVFAKKAKLLAGDDERLHEMLDEIINSEE